MRKAATSRTHVFSVEFDKICWFYGPGQDGNRNVARVVGRDVRTVSDWRSGARAAPRWAYELLRLTALERRRQMEEMTGRYRAVRKAFAGGFSSVLDRLYGTQAANDGFAVSPLFNADHQAAADRP